MYSNMIFNILLRQLSFQAAFDKEAEMIDIHQETRLLIWTTSFESHVGLLRACVDNCPWTLFGVVLHDRDRARTRLTTMGR